MARISHAGAALSIAISLLLFALVSHAAVIAGHANVPAKRHAVPAQLNIANATEHELTKRYTVNKSKWTYYKTGKGACGGTNKDSDWVCAPFEVCDTVLTSSLRNRLSPSTPVVSIAATGAGKPSSSSIMARVPKLKWLIAYVYVRTLVE